MSADEGDRQPGDDVDADWEVGDGDVSDTGVQAVFDDAWRSPTQFRHLTGLTVAEYDDLRDWMLPFILSTSNEGKPMLRKARDEQWKVKPRLQLFVTVVWLRLYFPIWFAAFFFKLPLRYVYKILKRCVPALARALNELPYAKGGMPTAEEIKKIAESEAPMQIGGVTMQTALDGMHLPIQGRQKKPSMTKEERAKVDEFQQTFKNAKHQVLATNVLVLVSAGGRLLRFWGPHLGAHEATHLKEDCDLADFLKQHGISVVADAGLCVNTAKRHSSKAFFTVGPKLVRLTKFVLNNKEKFKPETVQFFEEIYDSTRIASKIRIVVENWIGAARIWRVLRDVWRGYVGDPDGAPLYGLTQSDVLQAVFLLVNIRMLKRPLRAANWKPDVSKMPSAVYKYPGQHVNAKTLESAAALHFVQKPERGRPSLKAALAAARALVEPHKSKSKAQKSKEAVKDDVSELTMTSSDEQRPTWLDALSDDEEDEDRSMEGFKVMSQGAFLRKLTKEGAVADKKAKKAAASASEKKKKRRRVKKAAERSESAEDS